MLKAGTQDSGRFFCASYENWVVVFLASPAALAGFRTRWSSPGSGLQLLPILLIHKGFWAASKTPISRLGKKSVFLAVFFEMADRLSLPPAGLLARNDFRLARNPSRINAKRGDRFLQADLNVTDRPDLDNFRFADHPDRIRI
jgi:hypothetical protein